MDDSNWIPADLTRVTLDDPRAVDYWTKTLGATDEDLRQAMDNVGSNPDAIRTFLSRKDPLPPTVAG
jgi:hypothetical protein